MNSICITGYSPVDLTLVEKILNQAGMQPALPAQRDTSMSISVWHEQVAALLSKENNDEKDETGTSANLGRLWEQLAGDIFTSNLHSPIWGWADIRSESLLSFWKNFDPQLKFVLVVCSPERFISHAIQSSNETPNIEKILNNWHSNTEALLAFNKENSKRCIIINVQDCIDLPAIFIQTLNKKWRLQLNKVHFPNIADVDFSELTRYLAVGLVHVSTTNKELGDKLNKNYTLNPSGSRHKAILSYGELIQWYRKMRADVLVREQDQLAFQAKHNKLIDRFDQERIAGLQLSAQNLTLERKNKELKIEINSSCADFLHLQHLNIQLHEDNKLLKDINVQLDKAIEERDLQKVRLAELQDQLAAAQGAHKELNIALNSEKNEQEKQSTIVRDLTTKLSTAISQLDAAASVEKDLKDGYELLLLQLHQVQQELETSFLKCQEITKEFVRTQTQFSEVRDQLAVAQSEREDSNASLVAARTEQYRQSQIVSDLTTKLSTAISQFDAAASVEKDLKDGYELLLLQLHQVQQELETYFLKCQEVTKDVEVSQARWRRMLVRNPDYCDVESIEIEPLAKDKEHRAIWKIKGLDAGGRHIPEISFVTFIEKGIAGFEFSRAKDSGSAGLLRWPTSLSDDKTLTIAMSGDGTVREKRALAIIGLATSDWSLISVVIKLLRTVLQSPSLLKVPQNFDSVGLIKALDKLEINLKAIPEVVRYDKVKLKREQINPDYEHLWFAFENMESSGHLIGDFEYRISCTNVRPKKFGDHPKLEFPEETGKAVFQSWFDESYDDYGAKLELRFALPESMDMEVWGKLTTHDQVFVRDLVRQLPYVIEDLRLSGKTPKRGWDDWKQMIRETQRVLNIRTELSKPSPPIRKVTLRK